MELRTRLYKDKQQLFCPWRRKWVASTPEEQVRQQLLHHLVEQLDYPAARIAVEAPITLGAGVTRRCDAVIYSPQLQPIMLLEFKAQHVAITPKVLDQAAVYNTTVHAPWLILANGRQTVVAHIDQNNHITFLNHIPAWNQL